MFSFLLLFVVAILCIIIFYMHNSVVIANRRRHQQTKEVMREREATAAILGLAQKAISTDIGDESFLSIFIEYAQRTLHGRGGAVMTVQEDGSLKGCAVSGIFPPMRDVPNQVEQQLLAHDVKHTEFFREIKIYDGLEIFEALMPEKEGFAYYRHSPPEIFPKNFGKNAPIILMAPIKVKGNPFAYTIIVSGEEFDEHTINEEDGRYLVRLNEIASLSLEGIKVYRERRDYEKQVQTAKEEGMLQVSAGIIHNIGNAVTVAKLTILEMNEKCPKNLDDTPESLIAKIIVPTMEEKLREGKLQEFISSDPVGREYLGMMKDLLANITRRNSDMAIHTKSLSDKLSHISEIIELQQRFVGELGTENMVPLSQVVEASVKIFDETFNKYNVSIGVQAQDNLPKVLIDTSMISQVFINLIKNAVEAMEAHTSQRDKKIGIEVYADTLEGKKYVAAKVQDNGPGIDPNVIDRLFQFGVSTKEKKKHSRGYGLHSCMETVRKYGGTIKVESVKGEGSSFIVYLPIGDIK